MAKKFVWVYHNQTYLAAYIDSASQTHLTLVTVENERVVVPFSFVFPMNPGKFDLSPDLSFLSHLNVPSILHNLKMRYEHDLIYTNSGLFLIAVNPYKNLPDLYDKRAIQKYFRFDSKRSCGGGQSQLICDNLQDRSFVFVEPHIYKIANDAYNQLYFNRENQSILVTGESGAGKTENTKKVINFLAQVASKNDKVFKEQILNTNVVLEAFGNALTVKNDNSSRFGKFIKIIFKNGEIVGANVENYLLEKSRVTRVSLKERNYHIFYYLLSAIREWNLHKSRISGQFEVGDNLSPVQSALKSDYSNESKALNRADFVAEIVRSCYFEPGVLFTDFRYLKDTNFSYDFDDSLQFYELTNAFSILEFSVEEQISIYKVVSTILHIGNLEISEFNDQVSIQNLETAEIVCKLLKIPLESFLETLLKPIIRAGNEIVNHSRSKEQVIHIIEALSRLLYERLFETIIARINLVLNRKGLLSDTNFIGVLDIAGFEIFERNDFEQLCINYTNEKLQQFFNHHMFILEQEIYCKENIVWDYIDFGLDLQPTIDLIEKSNPIGIFSYLDEECLMPGGSDRQFLEKLKSLERLNYKEKRRSSLHYSNEANNAAISDNGNMRDNMNGTMSGVSGGTMSGNMNGDMRDNMNGTMSGVIGGTMSGNMKDPMNGNMKDPLNGTMNGNMNGTMNGNMNGNMNGTMNGNMSGTMNGPVSHVATKSTMNGTIRGNSKMSRTNSPMSHIRTNSPMVHGRGNTSSPHIRSVDNRASTHLFSLDPLDSGFYLNHYAGRVQYIVDSWILKNKDPHFDHISSLILKSEDQYVKKLFSYIYCGKKGFFRTTAQKHKDSLNLLMQQLKKTNPFFVRCILPNYNKKMNQFDYKLILDQLKCNGVMEGIRISKQGFPNKMSFKEFRKRYFILIHEQGDKLKDNKEATLEILKVFIKKKCNENGTDLNTKKLQNKIPSHNEGTDLYMKERKNEIPSHNEGTDLYSSDIQEQNSSLVHDVGAIHEDSTSQNRVKGQLPLTPPNDLFRVGNTMIFFRQGVLADFEDLRDSHQTLIALILQAKIRSILETRRKNKDKIIRNAVRIIQNNARESIKFRKWRWWKLFQKIKPLVEVSKFDEIIRNKENKIALFENQIKSKENEISIKNEKINNLKGLIENYKINFDEKEELIEGLRNEKNRIENENKEFKDKLKSIQDSKSKTDAYLKVLEQKNNDLLSDKNNKESILESKENIIKELKCNERKLKNDLDSLNKTYKEKITQLNQLNNQNYEGKLAQLNEKIEEENKKYKEAKKEFENEIKNLKEKQKNEMSENKKKLKNLQEDYERKNNQIQKKFNSEIIENKKKLENITKELSDLKNDKNVLENEKTNLLKELNKARINLNELENKNNELTDEFQNLLEINKNLKEEFNSKTEEYKKQFEISENENKKLFEDEKLKISKEFTKKFIEIEEKTTKKDKQIEELKKEIKKKEESLEKTKKDLKDSKENFKIHKKENEAKINDLLKKLNKAQNEAEDFNFIITEKNNQIHDLNEKNTSNKIKIEEFQKNNNELFEKLQNSEKTNEKIEKVKNETENNYQKLIKLLENNLKEIRTEFEAILHENKKNNELINKLTQENEKNSIEIEKINKKLNESEKNEENSNKLNEKLNKEKTQNENKILHLKSEINQLKTENKNFNNKIELKNIKIKNIIRELNEEKLRNQILKN